MANVQQVLHFYQHLAEATGIYIQQMLKGKILPTACRVIHLETTAAICEIPLELQPSPMATSHPSEKKALRAPKQSSVSKGPKPLRLVDSCLPKTSRNKADCRTA